MFEAVQVPAIQEPVTNLEHPFRSSNLRPISITTLGLNVTGK